MQNLINTSAGKYVVNVLLVIFFVVIAVTGLFFMEGGKSSGNGNRHNQEQFAGNYERSNRHELQGSVNFNRQRGFERGGGEGSEGLHQVAGIIWLILMFLHIWQHLNWYKKMFSLKHIRKNKLLTGTLVVFLLLVLTSIGLLTEIIPRGFFNLKEIHGFFGQVLVGLMLIHIIQRAKWYITTTKKLINQKALSVSTN